MPRCHYFCRSGEEIRIQADIPIATHRLRRNCWFYSLSPFGNIVTNHNMSSRSTDQSPLSIRDSLSPTPSNTNHQQNFEQPNSSQDKSNMVSSSSVQNQVLDLYGYHMSDALENYQISAPSLTLSNAPSISSPLALRSRHRPPPNILSADYDPFAPPHSEMAPSFGSALYAMQSVEVSRPLVSSSPSAIASQRSSISSAHASETYSNPESYHANYHQVKMENPFDWLSQTSGLGGTTSQADYSGLSNSVSCFPGSVEDTFLQQSSTMGWPKSQSLDTASFSASMERTTPSDTGSGLGSEAKGTLSTVARTRMPRKMTTREDANYQCKVKGCGKLFSRSYNFKAHMETHDASRSYPFPCPLSECNKKFVRKTDLQRHHQSVHMKERNFQCNFCSRYFARKDTLRRYVAYSLKFTVRLTSTGTWKTVALKDLMSTLPSMNRIIMQSQIMRPVPILYRLHIYRTP